ncbi:hypothetical protein AKJ16_DCAP12761 [Drosera capensis]
MDFGATVTSRILQKILGRYKKSLMRYSSIQCDVFDRNLFSSVLGFVDVYDSDVWLCGWCSDGKSRQFGFIGYRMVEEAEDAIKVRTMNFTYDTLKEEVNELWISIGQQGGLPSARKVGDPNIPRPWSRYSKEKEKKTEDGKIDSGQKDTSKGHKNGSQGQQKEWRNR